MQATTVTRELIQSVGDHVYHQGTSYKPLSPTKGTRNAEIIYQAIKNMPDNAVVRADFNAFGKPYIFFKPRCTSYLKPRFLREKRKQIKRRSAP